MLFSDFTHPSTIAALAVEAALLGLAVAAAFRGLPLRPVRRLARGLAAATLVLGLGGAAGMALELATSDLPFMLPHAPLGTFTGMTQLGLLVGIALFGLIALGASLAFRRPAPGGLVLVLAGFVGLLEEARKQVQDPSLPRASFVFGVVGVMLPVLAVGTLVLAAWWADRRPAAASLAVRARIVAGLVVSGAVASWLVAPLLLGVLVPLLLADPALAGMFAEVPPAPVFGVFAGIGALAGVVMLAGLSLAWRRPAHAAGRVLLLVGGATLAATGLLLWNIGTFDLGWHGAAALAGDGAAAAYLLTGLLAGRASLSGALPGPSLAARMTVSGPAPLAAISGRQMALLTLAVVTAWVGLAAAVVATHAAGPFIALQLGMPIVLGAVVTGWREGRRHRLPTLGLAALAGAVSGDLFLLVLVLARYYKFDPTSYVIWWGLVGAVLGAVGYGLWWDARSPRAAAASASSPGPAA